MSSSDCWLVGNGPGDTGSYGLIEHYNGSTWSVVPSPGASLAPRENSKTGSLPNGSLSGVSCTSSTDCWAVGQYSTQWAPYPNGGESLLQTLVEHYDGTMWQIIPSPTVAPLNGGIHPNGDYLSGVACASRSDCWAVGHMIASSGRPFGPVVRDSPVVIIPTASLILHYDGKAWSAVPAPSSVYNTELRGIACISSGECWAAGTEGGSQPLLLHLSNGKWSAASAAAPAGTVDGGVGAISCPAPGACWTGGYGFLLRWQGTSWTSLRLPKLIGGGGAYPVVLGVGCWSGDDCWAVGQRLTNGGTSIHFDGASWTTVDPKAPVGAAGFLLTAVTCVAAGDCWAVGSWGAQGKGNVLIEHWGS